MSSEEQLSQALRAVDQATTSDQLMTATTSLVRCRDLKAIPKLLEVIGYNNPALAGLAVSGLVALGRKAAPEILQNLDPQNYGARAWAVKALAEIGDSCALETLIHAVEHDIGPSVRRAATTGLGRLGVTDSPALTAEEQQRCLHTLSKACTDGEWIVRYAACVGLENQIQASDELFSEGLKRIEQLSSENEPVKVVRLRAARALERLRSQ